MRKIILSVVALALLGLGGCYCKKEPVTVTPLSGRFGYAFEGPLGFHGTLTKENLADAEWLLEGKFVFPSGGYRILEPEIRVAGSNPAQVYIKFPVVTPGPNDIVTMAITEAPISHFVSASNEASFSISVVAIQPAI